MTDAASPPSPPPSGLPAGRSLEISAPGRRLAAYLATPPTRTAGLPSIVIAHAFPGGPRGSANNPATLRTLADRVAADLGWLALTFTFTSVGASTGLFSITTWVDDLRVATDHLVQEQRANGVWLVGFGTGGALCICAGAADPRVRGVASAAAAADFDDWARNPRQLLDHAAAVGMRIAPAHARDQSTLVAELRAANAERAAAELAPRPLLVLHGSDDEAVPALDARALADAHGLADLRILPGASHYLRHDPRAIAILFGWLERQRSQALA